jgi:hypothetical protein
VQFDPGNTPNSAALFSAPGEYVLRFTVNDGALSAQDEVTFTVTPNSTTPPVVEVVPGATPGMTFTTQPGQSYTVIARKTIDSTEWTRVRDIPAGPGGEVITVPFDLTAPSQYYSVVSPQVPQ